jgi:hypothetical protein
MVRQKRDNNFHAPPVKGGMKIILKYLFIFITASAAFNNTSGQSNGDYRSRQSGTWNVNTTWEKYQGGNWISPSNDFPALTNIRTRITIQNGHTVTGNGNIRSQSSSAYLQINQGGTLNMGTYYIRSSNATGSRFPAIVVNGTLNTSSYVSAVTFTVGATGTFITSYVGANGWWNTTFSPTTVTLSGTVQYTGATNQRIPAYTCNNIMVSGTGTKILNGSIIINGLLTINTGVTLNMAAYTLSLNGPGILLNGVLQNNLGTITFGGGTQTISGTGSFSGSFNRLNIGTIAKSNTTLSVTSPLVMGNLMIDKSGTNTGSSFTISSSSQAQVLTSLDIFINGGLMLKSDALSTASLIAAATGLNGGTANADVELDLSGAPGGVMYHYISSPITLAPATIFSSVNVIDVLKYKESLITTDKANGWVAYDGWHYNSYTKAWENLGAAESWPAMIPGNGYDYYSSDNRTFIFQGRLNTAGTNVTLYYNSTGSAPDPNQQGFNLVGNPFTSGLDWDAVVAANNIWNNVGAAIYFTSNGRTYSYVNGITVPNDLGDGRYIPAMQGFFVKSNLNNVLLTIPASAKVHTSHARYKSATLIPAIRVQVDGAGKIDQAVIRFDKDATSAFDNRFDSRKIFPVAGSPSISASMSGEEMDIDGLPFPSDSTEIPLIFSAPVSGIYKLIANEISGLSGYNIFLNDKLLNKSLDLLQVNSYELTSDAGKFPGRFTISFVKNSETPVPENKLEIEAFRIYTAFGNLNVIPQGENIEWSYGDIRVVDLTGRTVLLLRKQELISGQSIQIPFSYPMGIYIVEIRTEERRFTAKVFKK